MKVVPLLDSFRGSDGVEERGYTGVGESTVGVEGESVTGGRMGEGESESSVPGTVVVHCVLKRNKEEEKEE